jgi:hypothetical protein
MRNRERPCPWWLGAEADVSRDREARAKHVPLPMSYSLIFFLNPTPTGPKIYEMPVYNTVTCTHTGLNNVRTQVN